MKRALVISGGGSKGAFAVGVLKELFASYPLLDFDLYVGSSTGSLVVALASVKKMETLEYLYTHLRNEDLLVRGNIVDKLNDTSIYDVTPLWNQIQLNYSDLDYQRLRSSGKRVFINTVCLQTQELTIFANDAAGVTPSGYCIIQTLDANHYRRALLASCCQPVFMQPIQVGRNVRGAANPSFQYVDGGVLEYIGLQAAIDAGATDILAIMLSPEEEYQPKPQFGDLMSILSETIDILVSDVGKNDVKLVEQQNAALKYISAVKTKMREAGVPDKTIEDYFSVGNHESFLQKAPVHIIKIRPRRPLGGGPGGLNFNPHEMADMLAAGRLACSDLVAHTDLSAFTTV